MARPLRRTHRPRPREAEPRTDDASAIADAFARSASPGTSQTAPSPTASPGRTQAGGGDGQLPITDQERENWGNQLLGFFQSLEQARGPHWHMNADKVPAIKHAAAATARKYLPESVAAGVFPELQLAALVLPELIRGLKVEAAAIVGWWSARGRPAGHQRRDPRAQGLGENYPGTETIGTALEMPGD